MKSIYMLYILIALWFSSCASTKQYGFLDKNQSSAKVYIIRDSWLWYSSTSKIYVKNEFLGKLGANNYLSFAPNSGQIELVGVLRYESRLPLQIQEGKTYYVRQKIKHRFFSSKWILELLNEEEGKKLLARVIPAKKDLK